MEIVFYLVLAATTANGGTALVQVGPFASIDQCKATRSMLDIGRGLGRTSECYQGTK